MSTHRGEEEFVITVLVKNIKKRKNYLLNVFSYQDILNRIDRNYLDLLKL